MRRVRFLLVPIADPVSDHFGLRFLGNRLGGRATLVRSLQSWRGEGWGCRGPAHEGERGPGLGTVSAVTTGLWPPTQVSRAGVSFQSWMG